MDALTSTTGVVAVAGCALAVVALAFVIANFVTLRRLRADQRVIIGDGTAPQDLVAHAATLQREHVALHTYVQDVAAGLDARLRTAETRLDDAITYTSLVRYDAYNEMSGHQSTTLAFLDTHRSGVVLSSIHHRDQARIYVKRITNGVGELQLSPEEEEAVRLALNPAAA